MALSSLEFGKDWANVEMAMANSNQQELQTMANALRDAAATAEKERGLDSLPSFVIRYVETLVKTMAHRRDITIR